MSALFGTFIRALMYFAGGVGVTSLIDKFVPDKLPAGTAPLSNINDNTGKVNWLKVGLIVTAGAIGIILVKFIGKKLNIKILK